MDSGSNSSSSNSSCSSYFSTSTDSSSIIASSNPICEVKNLNEVDSHQSLYCGNSLVQPHNGENDKRTPFEHTLLSQKSSSPTLLKNNSLDTLSPTSSGIVVLGNTMKDIFRDAFLGAKTVLDLALPLNIKKSSNATSRRSLSSPPTHSPTESLSPKSSSVSIISPSSSRNSKLIWFIPLEVLDYCTKNVVALTPRIFDQLSRLNYFDEINFYRFALMLNSEDGHSDWISQLIDTYLSNCYFSFIDDYFCQNFQKRMEPAAGRETPWKFLSSPNSHVGTLEKKLSRDAIFFSKFVYVDPDSVNWVDEKYIFSKTNGFASTSFLLYNISSSDLKNTLLAECIERLLANLTYDLYIPNCYFRSFNLIIAKKYSKDQKKFDLGLQQRKNIEFPIIHPTNRSKLLWNRACFSIRILILLLVLEQLEILRSPYEKIKAFYFSCTYLQEWILLSPANGSGADDFFPSLVALIESAKIPKLLLHLKYVEEYRSVISVENGIVGYYLTSIDAAIRYLSLSTITSNATIPLIPSIITDGISAIGDQFKSLFSVKKKSSRPSTPTPSFLNPLARLT